MTYISGWKLFTNVRPKFPENTCEFITPLFTTEDLGSLQCYLENHKSVIYQNFSLKSAQILLHCSGLNYTLLYCTVMCCTALHCTVLQCTALYCVPLYCTVLWCTVLHWTMLHYTVLYCAALYCTVLLWTILHCTMLYFTALYYTTLMCTVLYFIQLSCARLQCPPALCSQVSSRSFTTQKQKSRKAAMTAQNLVRRQKTSLNRIMAILLTHTDTLVLYSMFSVIQLKYSILFASIE